MRIPTRTVSFLIFTLILTSALLKGEISEMKTHTIDLPKTTGAWTRTDSPRIVTSQNIFDYMNGAGELYIGYRFEHLEVYEYTSENHDNKEWSGLHLPLFSCIPS